MGRAAEEKANRQADNSKKYSFESGVQSGAIMSDVTIVKEGWVQKRGKFYLSVESSSDASYAVCSGIMWLYTRPLFIYLVVCSKLI